MLTAQLREKSLGKILHSGKEREQFTVITKIPKAKSERQSDSQIKSGRDRDRLRQRLD